MKIIFCFYWVEEAVNRFYDREIPLSEVSLDDRTRTYYFETNLDSILPVGTTVYMVDDDKFSRQFRVAELLYEYDQDLLHSMVDIEDDEKMNPGEFIKYLKKHWTFSP